MAACVTFFLLHEHAPAEPAMDPTAASLATDAEEDGFAGDKVLSRVPPLIWHNVHTFMTFVPSCRRLQQVLR